MAENLTARERVWQAIRQGVAGRPPKGELCVNDDLICSCRGCSQPAFQDRYRFAELLGLDLYTLAPAYPSSNRIPEAEECRWTDLDRWVQDTPLFTFALLDGPFQWGMRVAGLQEFMVMPRKDPDTLRQLVQRVEKLNSAMLSQLAASGIDGVIIGDDVAYNRGLLAGAKILREYFLPSIFRQVEQAHKLGMPVFFHSDGNYKEIIPDLMEAGFDGIHCLEREAGMDLFSLQEQTGNKLCLWGHLSFRDLEEAEDPASLQEALALIQKASRGKKFILGTTSGLFRGLPLKPLQALYDSVKNVK